MISTMVSTVNIVADLARARHPRLMVDDDARPRQGHSAACTVAALWPWRGRASSSTINRGCRARARSATMLTVDTIVDIMHYVRHHSLTAKDTCIYIQATVVACFFG